MGLVIALAGVAGIVLGGWSGYHYRRREHLREARLLRYSKYLETADSARWNAVRVAGGDPQAPDLLSLTLQITRMSDQLQLVMFVSPAALLPATKELDAATRDLVVLVGTRDDIDLEAFQLGLARAGYAAQTFRQLAKPLLWGRPNRREEKRTAAAWVSRSERADADIAEALEP